MLLLRQNAETPTEQEWDGFLQVLAEHRDQLSQCKILIRTDGGGPSPQQRNQLQRVLSRTPVRVAVVSDNMKVRFVASTIALFHADHRAFSTKEIREAYQHLQMTPTEQRLAEQALEEMRHSLA